MSEIPPEQPGAEASLSGHAPDTKQRLLDAAMKIFAERGFQATSMRAITQEAGTSLSAANYHYGSKEELLRAALQERAGILNARRRELLQRAEAEAGPDHVERVIDAYVRPVFERQAEMIAKGVAPPGLAVRLYLDPPEVISKIRHEAFHSTNRLFAEALSSALPEASATEVERALKFVLGLVVNAVSEAEEWETNGSEWVAKEHPRLKGLVVFAAAGVRALASPSATPGELS